ncbi:NUDIX domain-containing protein [Pedobacter sp. BS3]|uniref:NUDIX hydrolase n=1 Tax=Pedobacter sp. BS3 TaxID=2567937 RepID=UPI0011EDA957|nr:NUDIX domain-containing protein [Pedobacter sp. BS3]TZF83990.1 NUDIX domain-containing protein [Pedobacter sp. BS3]
MKQSAGILLYRLTGKAPEFFLVHPGGPFFIKKDAGWWSIPKGEMMPDEEPLDAAIREFEEETGYRPSGEFKALQPVTQKGGKKVYCWLVAGDLDPETITCNTFELEWPPRSGKKASFPEIDRAAWFSLNEARQKMNEKQVAFLDEAVGMLT